MPLDEFGLESGNGQELEREQQEDPGFIRQALGIGLDIIEPIGWTLDLLSRPIRTFIGTGDLERAHDSIGDSSQALYGRDLLDSIGIGTIGYADGKFDWGDIPDFLIETGVEMVLDPLTYTGIGAVTKLGAKTANVGRTAMRALSFSDEIVGDLAKASTRAQKAVKIAQKAGLKGDYSLEMADDVAKWINGQSAREGLKLKVKTLDDVMPDWDDIQQAIKMGVDPKEMAGDLERLAAAKVEVRTGLQDKLSHFGLGKSWADQMRNGERAILGFGWNPIGAADTPLFGTGESAGVNFMKWLDDTSGIVGAIAEGSPIAKPVISAMAKTKEALFNPSANTAFEEIVRSAGGVGMIEKKAIERDIIGFWQDIDANGLRPISTKIIDYANSSVDGALKDAAEKDIRAWARANGKDEVEIAAKMARMGERYNAINARTLAWEVEHDTNIKALGDLQQGLMDEYKSIVGKEDQLEIDTIAAQKKYNQLLEMRNKAADAIALETHDLKKAEWDKYAAARASVESANAARKLRKQAAARLTAAGVDKVRKDRIMEGLDAAAKAYADETGEAAENWYVRVGGQLQLEEMYRYERVDLTLATPSGTLGTEVQHGTSSIPRGRGTYPSLAPTVEAGREATEGTAGREFYHGKTRIFEGFDKRYDSGTNLVGPGVNLAEDPDVAFKYAKRSLSRTLGFIQKDKLKDVLKMDRDSLGKLIAHERSLLSDVKNPSVRKAREDAIAQLEDYRNGKIVPHVQVVEYSPKNVLDIGRSDSGRYVSGGSVIPEEQWVKLRDAARALGMDMPASRNGWDIAHALKSQYGNDALARAASEAGFDTIKFTHEGGRMQKAPYVVYSALDFGAAHDRKLKGTNVLRGVYSANPELNKILSMDSGVAEGYSVASHTMRALDRLSNLPRTKNTDFLATVVALHDAGKGLAYKAGEESAQHAYTIPILEKTMKSMGSSADDIRLAKALVDHDIIGDLVKGKLDLKAANNLLAAQAAKGGVSSREFVEMARILWEVDAGSYPKLYQQLFKDGVPKASGMLDELLGMANPTTATKIQGGPSVENLIRGLSSADKAALGNAYGLPNGQTLKQLMAKNASPEELDKARRAEVYIEQAIAQGVDDPVINKLRRQAAAVQTGERAVGLRKELPYPKKPAYFATTGLGDRIIAGKNLVPGGIKDPHMMSLMEFTKEIEGISGKVYPDVSSIEIAHRRAIRQAIDKGFFVPSKAFEGHELYSKAFAPNGKWQQVNNANISKSKDLLSARDFGSLLKQERKAAKELVKRQGKMADQGVMQSIEQVVNRYQTEVLDKLPNYARVMFTAEAADMTVRLNETGKMNLNSNTIARHFLGTGGLPLSPSQLNKIIREEPDRIHRLIATAGRLPEGTPGMMKTLNAAFRPDEATYIAIAKQMTGKDVPDAAAITAARNLPPLERLKFFRQAYATVFEERPEVLLSANLDAAARHINNKEFKNAMLRMFAKPVKRVAENEASLSMLKQIKDTEKQIASGKAPKGARDLLEKLKDQYAHSGGDSVDAGWVRAAGLGEELEGMQMKAEVYKQAVTYLNGKVFAANIKNAIPALTSTVKAWKLAQLFAPGSFLRNIYGDMALMMQNDMFSHEASMRTGDFISLIRSNGDSEKLAQIGSFKLGANTYTADQMYRIATREGLFALNDVAQEMSASLTKKAQRGPVGKAFGKVMDKWNNLNDMQRGVSRLQGFYSRMAKGDSIEEAAARVNMALYDYSRVSPAVEFARTTGAIPFATWMSKNIPAQLELLFTRPGQYAAMIHAKNVIEQGEPGVSEQDLPRYVRDKFNMVYHRDENGKVYFTTLSNVIPAADLWEVAGDPFALFANALGPVPKYVIERATNRSLFTQQDIKKFDQDFDIILPGTADVQVPVWKAHAVRLAAGRPLSMFESVGEVLAGSVDPKTGQPKTLLSRSGMSSFAIGLSLKEVDVRAALMDDVAEIERNIRDMKAAASRWGRRGYMKEEQQLLQQAHELEEKLNSGRWQKGRTMLRQSQQDRRRQTDQRRSGYGQQ